MSREIPRSIAEECFRMVSGESLRERVSVEFDVVAWHRAEIEVPEFHPASEPVPDPGASGKILEVMAPTRMVRGLFGAVESPCLYPVFAPGMTHPSGASYWSGITRPRDTRILRDDPEHQLALAIGPWRIWEADTLLRAAEMFREHGTERGTDHLVESIREIVDWGRSCA